MKTPMERLKDFVDTAIAEMGDDWKDFPIAWTAVTMEDVLDVASDMSIQVSDSKVSEILNTFHNSTIIDGIDSRLSDIMSKK